MSLLFMDNFSFYGSGSTGIAKMKEGLWADTSSTPRLVVDPDGVSGGLVLECSDSGTEAIRMVFAQGVQTTVGVHVRVYFPNISPTNTGFIRLLDADASQQISIKMDASGYLHAYKGSTSGTLIGSTALPVIVASSWIHLEIKVVFSDTVGTFELRVDEVAKIGPLTGIDTVSTAKIEASGVYLGNGSNSSVSFKDLVVWNGSGAVNNDFMGDHEVFLITETGDTDLNWTASTGSTGYNLLDETTPDDTDYVSADDSPPDASEFALTDLDPDVVVVAGLQTVVRALKTDSGAANLQVSLKSGVSTDAGADRPISTSATYYADICELDPATAASWTPSGVNAATILIDRTA